MFKFKKILLINVCFQHNKSYARISYEQNVNAFLIRFFRANDLIAFDVKGLTPGVVPYFKSLIINNVEYCQDPEVVRFQTFTYLY